VTAAAPLEIIPVYLRAGGEVEPFGPAESLDSSGTAE
jgi:hypothetical protein